MLQRVVVLMLLATVTVTAQGVAPEVRARLDAVVKAFSSGSAEAFEAMAQASFAPELLARRTPDERKRLLAQVHGELGTLDPVEENATAGGRFQIGVRGSKGGQATLMIDLETSAPYRITNLGLRIGGDAGGAGRDAAPAPPISPSMPAAELANALDAYLAPLAASGDFAGVVLVAKDGKPLFERGYGPADRERNVATTPDLRFNVASIGKAFTKVAIGQLISQGKLALTDTIGAKLPDYPNKDARVATIDQLLNHTGGIADFFGEEFVRLPKNRFASNADYYRYVSAKPLLFTPGSRNQYCNGCYIVLGEIIARVSGMRYEQYIADRVLKAAGMTGAGFLSYGDPRVAPAHTRRRGTTPSSAIGAHGRRGSAAGGSFARAADLLAFDNAVREGRLLDRKMTGWFFGGAADGPRMLAPYGIAGGAPGANAVLESDGVWTVVIVGNLDPPNASRIGMAIKSKLR